MNEPPSKTFDKRVPVLDKPADAPVERAETLASRFGLTNADLDEVMRRMLAVVWRVGCPGHLSPREVVHDAFVTALSKPISEWDKCADKEQLFALLCKLAELAALTNRKSKHRRLLGEGHTVAELEALLSIVGHADAVGARETLDKAFEKLSSTDRELVIAHHLDGKTIHEIADEKNVSWSTTNSRYLRAMDRLRAAMRWLVVTILLLFTKNARAQHVRLAWRGSRWSVHAGQTACAVTVTVACGALVRASSSAALVRPDVAHVATMAPLSPTIIAAAMSQRLPAYVEVAPEKPPAVDMTNTRCSASAMTTLKLASYFQSAVLPFALLVSPAMTQVACAGAERQTVTPQEPEEDEDDHFGTDPYDAICTMARHRGQNCPTRQEWYRQIGVCPDGTTKCQEK